MLIISTDFFITFFSTITIVLNICVFYLISSKLVVYKNLLKNFHAATTTSKNLDVPNQNAFNSFRRKFRKLCFLFLLCP